MGRRLQLQTVLDSIEGPTKVHYQPPANVRLTYPCILYTLSNELSRHANNNLYMNKKRYTITVIDANPDSLIPDEILRLPLSSFSRRFMNDGLYHTVYDVYY